MPHAEIEKMVLGELVEEAKSEKFLEGKKECTISIVSLIVGGLLLLTSLSWIGVIVIIVAVFNLIAGILRWSQMRDVKPDPYLLKGRLHNARNSSIGNCPICASELIVYDSVTDHNFECSVCTANLHIQNYEVVAR